MSTITMAIFYAILRFSLFLAFKIEEYIKDKMYKKEETIILKADGICPKCGYKTPTVRGCEVCGVEFAGYVDKNNKLIIFRRKK